MCVMSYFDSLINRVKNNPATLLAGPLNSPAAHVLKLDSLADSLFQPGQVESFVNAQTGAAPTGVQQLQMQREDTQYQRASADLQAAGLNQAMMYGKSVQPAPSSAGGNSSPSSFSDLIELALLPVQIENLKSQSKEKEAQAAKLASDTSLNEQLRLFNDEINPLRVRAQELANNLSSAEEKKIYRQMDEIGEHMKKLAAETESEQERKSLLIAQTLFENARARQITELLPYEKMLKSAQTSAAKAAAALSAVNAAYQQRLLDSNYLDDMFREMSAKASSAESRAQMEQIRASIRHGTFGVQELGDNVIADTIEAIQSFGSQTLAGFVNFVDNLNPFGSMLK